MLNNNWYVYYIYSAAGGYESEYTNEADARTHYNALPSNYGPNVARILYHENAAYGIFTAHFLPHMISEHPNYTGLLSSSYVKDSGSGIGTYVLPVFSTNN